MDWEEQRDNLAEVVMAVFVAEDKVVKGTPEIRERLKSRTLSSEEYCELIANELMSMYDEEEEYERPLTGFEN